MRILIKIEISLGGPEVYAVTASSKSPLALPIFQFIKVVPRYDGGKVVMVFYKDNSCSFLVN